MWFYFCAFGVFRFSLLSLPDLGELPGLIDPEDMVLLREAVARLKTKQREARSARREHGEKAASAPSA